MKLKPLILYLVLGFVFFAMIACNFGVSSAPKTIDYNFINTAAAQTVEVLYLAKPAETYAAKLTEISQSGNSIPVTGDQVTPTLQNTAVPSATATRIPPTATAVPPSPTPIPPTPIPCNWVKFIDDLSMPDNSAIHPNLSFTKTWRLQNIGTCAWTSDYQVVFSTGEAMGGPVSQKLGRTVNPGEMIDLTISQMSPSVLGSHTGYWMLSTPQGAVFGLGPNQSKPFWVMVNVVAIPTINTNTPLDVAANYCAAVWTNSSGTTLGCPAQSENFSSGSIMLNNAPKIEKAYQDDEPALITIPNNGTGGFISGRFPDVIVKSGDHFRALTGCLADSPNCSVGFEVKYSADGGNVQSLSTWTETYDGNWTRPDIDLTFLAGKHVQFILQVSNSNNSSTDDRAFWMVPKIGP